jgi:hypothetical protein
MLEFPVTVGARAGVIVGTDDVEFNVVASLAIVGIFNSENAALACLRHWVQVASSWFHSPLHKRIHR